MPLSPSQIPAGSAGLPAAFLAAVREVLPPEACAFDEPLSEHTTFRIGGPAALFARPRTQEQVAVLVAAAREHDVPLACLGGGSNYLCADAGFPGVVLHLDTEGPLGTITPDATGTRLLVGAAVPTRMLVRVALEQGMTAFVSLAGIPGSVGGALAMNADTTPEGIGRFVSRVEGVDLASGAAVSLDAAQLTWGYRSSSLRDTVLITGVVLASVIRGDVTAAQAAMADHLAARRAHQPLDLPNAGSIFRNPPQAPAGRLIEACGLKGTRIGGAAISTVHANFIVNEGGASAADVHALVDTARKAVAETYGIELETEIRFLG